MIVDSEMVFDLVSCGLCSFVSSLKEFIPGGSHYGVPICMSVTLALAEHYSLVTREIHCQALCARSLLVFDFIHTSLVF